MQNIKSKEKIPLNKITKEKIDYGKQFKIEEDINDIFNKLNSNTQSNNKEENLNFERENLNNIKEENEINEKDGNSLYSYDLKNNSFNSKEFESHKSTIIEKSLNLDNIINIEVSNNLNENLANNENGIHNSNNNSFENNYNKEYFAKKQKNNKSNNKDNNAIDTSVNRNDGTTQNILSLNNNNEKGKNLYIIKKYNKDNKMNELNKEDNKIPIKKNNSKKCYLYRKICIFFLCIIIILIIIIQILIFLKFL